MLLLVTLRVLESRVSSPALRVVKLSPAQCRLFHVDAYTVVGAWLDTMGAIKAVVAVGIGHGGGRSHNPAFNVERYP